MREVYKLISRYGDVYYLRKINNTENQYTLETDQPFRVIYNKSEEVFAIDPSGGPLLSIGFKVDENTVIKEINKDLIICLWNSTM